MDGEHLTLPFPAVTSAEEAKKALLAALTSTNIRTVLIQGVTGSAKTTLVRSLATITDADIVILPLGSTADRIFGTVDLERTIREGVRHASESILARSDGNILHADDVNLMEPALLDELLTSVCERRVRVEREGISFSYRTDTTFVATMNTAEVPLYDNLLDRFDICVRLDTIADPDQRIGLLGTKLSFDNSPKEVTEAYREECESIRQRVRKARGRLPFVTIPEDIMRLMAELCLKLGTEGHRGDIALANVSMAVAALDERDVVTLDDMKEASALCLRHRMAEEPPEIPPQEDSRKDDGQPQDASGDSSPEGSSACEPDNASCGGPAGCSGAGSPENKVYEIGETFSVIDFVSLRPFAYSGPSLRSGRHYGSGTVSSTGRYVGYEMPRGKVTDLAFDASVRAAAPYQRSRSHGDLALVLEERDLRQKVREKKRGTCILFVVDASGSMGARKRMVAVKGAVLSLLQESYCNRDRVGLISFRKDVAEMLLPFTKSVDFAYKKLGDMPTGGTTPLAEAIRKAHIEAKREVGANPGERCFTVLVTDGRANVPLSEGGDAFADALGAAEIVGREDVSTWIVVDSGTGYPHIDNALRLSRSLNGMYFRLEDLRSEGLAGRLKAVTG